MRYPVAFGYTQVPVHPNVHVGMGHNAHLPCMALFHLYNTGHGGGGIAQGLGQGRVQLFVGKLTNGWACNLVSVDQI